MNQERIQELINECTTISDDMVYDGESWHMKTYEYFDKRKVCQAHYSGMHEPGSISSTSQLELIQCGKTSRNISGSKNEHEF